jgi:hypothetical protein
MPWTAKVQRAEIGSQNRSDLFPPASDFRVPISESCAALDPAERIFLLHLQVQALHYFLDNQQPCGLFLDRQHNHGPRRAHGLCSLAATGMGFIALALASAPPYHLLPRRAALERIREGLAAAFACVPHDHGVLPHFVDSASGAVHGADRFSTVETAWVAAGALWAAAFLDDPATQEQAQKLYDRIDWAYWAAESGLLRHGKGADGEFLTCCWDRVNGETAFMYVLAAGAGEGLALPSSSWSALQPFWGVTAGLRFNSADLGLFVFQYGLDLLDLRRWRAPGPVDLWQEAKRAAQANERICRQSSTRFATYRRFWGLSAGDGPGPDGDTYRAYSPAGPIDGTAHLTATVASVVHHPEAVLRNLYEAHHDVALGARGRYGFSNVNLDVGGQAWVAHDMVGIDAGAAVLALDNYLMADRVRLVFQSLPSVRRGLARLGFSSAAQLPVASAAR